MQTTSQLSLPLSAHPQGVTLLVLAVPAFVESRELLEAVKCARSSL